jgi:hypothetical protein
VRPIVQAWTVSRIESRYASCRTSPPDLIEDLIIAAQPILSAPEAVKPSLTPRRRNAPRTAELLWHRHGEANARKIARREQKQARQKRSRTQFAFWAAVGAEIELRTGIAPDDREAKSVSLNAGQTSGEGVGAEILEGKESE